MRIASVYTVTLALAFFAPSSGGVIPTRPPIYNCYRSSYYQMTKDLTRYTSCVPANLDVGTCRGRCFDNPFTKECTICSVRKFATQVIHCRNTIGNVVPVKVDVVKSCACRDFPTTSVTPTQTRRPTNRPTARPSCGPRPPIRPVCLRWMGHVKAAAGFRCSNETDAMIDARLNAECANAYPGTRAITGAEIRANNLIPNSIECLPPLAPSILVPRCPYCSGCDCGGTRVCALSTNRAWNDVENWSPNHVGSVAYAGCVKACTDQPCR